MKNLLLIVTLLFSFILNAQVVSQEFELTPENFRSKSESDKDYIVIEVPGKTNNELFNKSKQFINQYYNNPKFVTSESDNSQIVINAYGSKYSMTMFSWYNEYQIELQFKDGKIKLSPKFKWIKNYNGGDDIPLVLSSGYMWAVFNKKGKVMRSKSKEIAEQDLKDFVTGLLNKFHESSDNW